MSKGVWTTSSPCEGGLEVVQTPLDIAQNYIQCLREFGQLPARLRTDCGTENGTMAAIQCALRSQHTDDFAGARSHMYGTSTANQRIESWWSFFRKQRYIYIYKCPILLCEVIVAEISNLILEKSICRN